MSEKVLKIDDWYNDLGKDDPILSIPLASYRKIWKAARQGMIEDNGQYIKIPPVEEWPNWAKAIDIGFWEFYENTTAVVDENYRNITRIRRPIPAWRPKKGEWVWKIWEDGSKALMMFGVAARCQYAALRDFNTEKDFTWEQFCERGDVWSAE